MFLKFLFFLIVFIIPSGFAQTGFEFNGQVNSEYISSTAYLNKVEDLNKKNRFFTENIIKESRIDSLGYFIFKGDFLPEENGIYKIYIDNCSQKIEHSNHILDRCQNHISILFIANNSSLLSFPLNGLNQIFCELKTKNKLNSIVQQIDSFQNHILVDLNLAKNDRQRQIVYKKSFFRLQDFSRKFNEPLAELYAFYLYSESESFNRAYFLEDIKTSSYYSELEQGLKEQYPNSSYFKQYKNDIAFFKPKENDKSSSIAIYIISSLLFISVFFNVYFLITKRETKDEILETKEKVNYKDILTNQEQKIFELMHSGLTNKAIAESLFISLSTVKSHINSIYSKLKISSRKEVSTFF